MKTPEELLQMAVERIAWLEEELKKELHRKAYYEKAIEQKKEQKEISHE